MRIKITKCTLPKSWYKDRIGEIFVVIEESTDVKGNKTYIVHKGTQLDSFVLDSDCEIIPLSKLPIVDKTHIEKEQYNSSKAFYFMFILLLITALFATMLFFVKYISHEVK